MTKEQARPTQATAAIVATAVGALVSVALSWDNIANLHSLSSQEAIQKSLGSNPPGGMTVATMTAIMHGANLVQGAGAAAALVLAAYVWQRQKPARLALSILAPLLVLAGLFTGNLLVGLIAAAALSLWLQPSRGWFDGTPPRSPADAAAGRTVASPWTAGSSVPGPSGTAPAPDRTWAPPSGPAQQPHWSAPAPRPYAMVSASRRPATVMWACLFAAGVSVLTFVALGAVLMLLVAEPTTLLDEVHRLQPNAPFSDQELLTTTKAVVVVFMVWAALGAVLGLLALRGGAIARRALLVSCVATALVSLVALAAGGFLAIAQLAAAVVVLALLLRPESQAWFRRNR